MIELGRFTNSDGATFVLTRDDTETWIARLGVQPQNVRRLAVDFAEEEKAAIDAIAPMIWYLAPHDADMYAGLIGTASKPQRAQLAQAWVYQMGGLIADGFFAEVTHEERYCKWRIWDSAEQEAYLQQFGHTITMDAYAVMRGFAPRSDAAAFFLHSYAERAGCHYKSHALEPRLCWYARYGPWEHTMAWWLAYCEQERLDRNAAWRKRLLGLERPEYLPVVR